MKKNALIIVLAVVCFSTVFLTLNAAETDKLPTFQYATIHWGGRNNTHVIRPNGQVEFLSAQFKSIKKPERADERSFYMNVVMNALAKEGYEFVGMTTDEIVMKKPVSP
jgi:hypothetical protein